MRYPFIDFVASNRLFADELEQAARRVIRSGRYIGGPEVEEFESDLCKTVGTEYAVGVSNGMDALRLIFRSYIELGRLTPGDEVLVSANTFVASFLAVSDAGLVPVPVDADPSTMNMDTGLLESLFTPRTKAILTVHIYGRVSYDSAMGSFARKNGLLLIEDSAQAIGASTVCAGKVLNAGAIGDSAAFSFYPTKNIGALGDAGAVTTSDKALADMVRKLANYGVAGQYHYDRLGFNCRMDSLQAALLGVKLRHIGVETAHRRKLAAIYDSCIRNTLVTKPLLDNPDMSVWHQYAVRVRNRDIFLRYLEDNGIGTNITYPVPPHLQQCYAGYGFVAQPVTEDICRTVLSLPVSRCTTEANAREIANIINGYRE